MLILFIHFFCAGDDPDDVDFDPDITSERPVIKVLFIKF